MMKMTFDGTVRRLALAAALGALAAGCTGCDRQEGPRAIHELEIKPGMGGGGMPRDAVHGFSGGESVAPPPGESPDLSFDAPEGWVHEPGSGMRAATFKIKDGKEVKEATIVILPDVDDGFASNIRRWSGQLGMQLDEARLESFIAEREGFTTVQGVPGALFDFTRLEGIPDSGKGSMLASIIETGGQSIFVKLTGGKAFLRQNKDRLLGLSKSIRVDAGKPAAPSAPSAEPATGPASGAPMAGAPAGSAPMGGNMGGGMSMQSTDPAFNRKPDGVSRLTWKTPAGWKSLDAKGMRTGSFAVTHGGKTADGSIVQLPGPAGGVESNVRRWMEQAGLAQLDDGAMKSFLESQRRIRTRDGYDGILVNTASLLNGNLLQENAILAAIIHAPEETIFVKLTGPRTVLLENVEAVAQLSASLAVSD